MLKTLKGRLSFWFTIICLVPLTVLTTMIYFHRVKVARDLVYDKLTVISSQRQAEIVDFLDGLAGDIRVIADSDRVVTAAQSLVHSPAKGPGRINPGELVVLRSYLNEHKKYGDISIVAQTGRILFSTDEKLRGTSIATPAIIDAGLHDHAPVFGDVYRDAQSGIPTMDIAVAITPAGAGYVPAALVIHLDLPQTIYRFIDNRTGLGQTGESFLVNRNTMALSELRWMKGATLKKRITGKPAQLAAQGQSGLIEATDYRGETVLAAYTSIPQTGWGLVCKQDTNEVNAPLKMLLYATYGFVVWVSAIACFFAFRLADSISQPIRDIARRSEEIGAGDFRSRITPEGTNEVKQLAASLNTMADALHIKMDAQEGVAQISELIMTAESMDSFFHGLLPVFMRVTGAKMAVAFMEEEQTRLFAPVHAIGTDASRVRKFSRNDLEGELGILLARGGITSFKGSDEESGLRLVTSFGDITPAEIISIPISVDHELRAFVSLASEQYFSRTAREIIAQAEVPLCAGFARVRAGEDVHKLAGELSLKNMELMQQATELRQQSMELTLQTEELGQRNRILDQQKRQLQEGTRLKSEFLSNMSHELRTPLNSVLALSRVLSAQCSNRITEEETGYLAIIERNGRHLLSLINDILDLAKIESGRLDVVYESVSLPAVAKEVIDGLTPIAREKGITIQLVPHGVVPPLVSDVKKLRQILQNLIGNAVKFTHKGSVTIRINGDADCLVIRVEDTGIGIAPEYLDTIFEEFRQADGSTSRSYEGTGLGLAIVRKTVHLLGGDVTVQSELHHGSTFTIRVPLDDRKTKYDSRDLPHVPAAFLPSFQEPQRKCVLVVDDDPESVSLIAAHLSHAGYDTVTALNGPDALRLARARQPYAITLDIMMPDMDGWEVMQELKKQPSSAAIPIVIVSLSEDRETGVALGAVGIVSKPVVKEKLLEEFRKLSGTGCRLVLVVDDDEHDRLFIASMLKDAGMDVLMAENGEQAVALAGEHHPDFITLDMVMPGMDGAAVIDRLRSAKVTADIPIVVITSKDIASAELTHLSSSVSAILAKGGLDRDVMLDELVESLDRIGWSMPHNATPAASRILIVEDSEAATIQLRLALESAGFNVDAVSGGGLALDYLSSHVPDGIILDLMMPEIDGFAVLASARRSPLTAKVPVMIMTAKTLSPGDYERIRALDVRFVVQKGDVDQQELLCRVYEMLGIATLFHTDRKLLPQITAPAAARAAGDGPILVVEDNPDNLATIKAVLGHDYALVEATDGEAGLALARSGAPSLILLDMQLPCKDGMTVLRELKSDPATSAIPVIALTASAMAGDMEMFLQMGCSEYVSKPYDVETLKQVVRSYYENEYGRNTI